MGWLLFLLFGGDILTLKAIESGCKHSKVFRGIVIFIVCLAFVLLLLVLVIISQLR
jgi:hypothetical protein